MEYVYSALLLHSAKKEINESNVQAVLKAAGVTADAGRVKALVAALEGADIAAAIKNASAAPVAMAAAPAAAAPAAKAEEKPEEKGVSEEEAAAGLGALFG
jgi:large subunit ribosomal protein L12